MTGHFLQSKEWEEFQKSLGREVFRGGEILVTKLPLIMSKSYLCAAGVDLRFMIYDLRKFAQEHNAVFLKIEPMTEDRALAQELINAGFVKANKEVQPQKTIVLDISGADDEILKRMREKTRYNIRLAAKKDLRFKIYALGKGASRFEEFWALTEKTAERDKFSTHTKNYYQQLLELSIVKLLAAELNGRLIAANIVLFYGGTAYYLHGASDYEYRNLMAPYLLHWETIKYAKAQGYKKYDLWGINEKKWPGVTRFKRGFGGKEIEYVGSYDYVFQPFWYRLYNLRRILKCGLF